MKLFRCRLAGRKGVTMIEVTIGASLLTLVLFGTLAVFTSMINLWSKGTSGTSSNSYASIGMRKLVLDIEEGKSATANSDGTRLTVTFPYRVSATSDYVRGQNGVVATYFLSGSTGVETTGELTYLWKSVGTVKTKLADHITRKDSATPPFQVTSGRLIRIILKGEVQEGSSATISPNLIVQAVNLRN